MKELRKLEELTQIVKPQNTKMVTMPLEEYNQDIEYVKKVTEKEVTTRIENTRIFAICEERNTYHELSCLLWDFINDNYPDNTVQANLLVDYIKKTNYSKYELQDLQTLLLASNTEIKRIEKLFK